MRSERTAPPTFLAVGDRVAVFVKARGSAPSTSSAAATAVAQPLLSVKDLPLFFEVLRETNVAPLGSLVTATASSSSFSYLVTAPLSASAAALSGIRQASAAQQQQHQGTPSAGHFATLSASLLSLGAAASSSSFSSSPSASGASQTRGVWVAGTVEGFIREEVGGSGSGNGVAALSAEGGGGAYALLASAAERAAEERLKQALPLVAAASVGGGSGPLALLPALPKGLSASLFAPLLSPATTSSQQQQSHSPFPVIEGDVSSALFAASSSAMAAMARLRGEESAAAAVGALPSSPTASSPLSSSSALLPQSTAEATSAAAAKKAALLPLGTAVAAAFSFACIRLDSEASANGASWGQFEADGGGGAPFASSLGLEAALGGGGSVGGGVPPHAAQLAANGNRGLFIAPMVAGSFIIPLPPAVGGSGSGAAEGGGGGATMAAAALAKGVTSLDNLISDVTSAAPPAALLALQRRFLEPHTYRIAAPLPPLSPSSSQNPLKGSSAGAAAVPTPPITVALPCRPYTFLNSDCLAAVNPYRPVPEVSVGSAAVMAALAPGGNNGNSSGTTSTTTATTTAAARHPLPTLLNSSRAAKALLVDVPGPRALARRAMALLLSQNRGGGGDDAEGGGMLSEGSSSASMDECIDRVAVVVTGCSGSGKTVASTIVLSEVAAVGSMRRDGDFLSSTRVRRKGDEYNNNGGGAVDAEVALLERCVPRVLRGALPQQRSKGSSSSSSSSVAQRILQKLVDAAPALESFGNASTRNNANSSRFVKSTSIYFADGAVEMATAGAGAAHRRRIGLTAVVGAVTKCHLLETTRVVSLASMGGGGGGGMGGGVGAGAEGPFHAFSLMFSSGGLSHEQRMRFDVWDASLFKCMAMGGGGGGGGRPAGGGGGVHVSSSSSTLPPTPFAFRDVVASLASIGLSHSEIDGVFATLAGIMHLLNVEFWAADEYSPATVPRQPSSSSLGGGAEAPFGGGGGAFGAVADDAAIASSHAALTQAAKLLLGDMYVTLLADGGSGGGGAGGGGGGTVEGADGLVSIASPVAASPPPLNLPPPEEVLLQALTTVVVGHGVGPRQLHKAAAYASRDTLAKCLYQSIFDLILCRLNAACAAPPPSSSDAVSSPLSGGSAAPAPNPATAAPTATASSSSAHSAKDLIAKAMRAMQASREVGAMGPTASANANVAVASKGSVIASPLSPDSVAGGGGGGGAKAGGGEDATCFSPQVFHATALEGFRARVEALCEGRAVNSGNAEDGTQGEHIGDEDGDALEGIAATKGGSDGGRMLASTLRIALGGGGALEMPAEGGAAAGALVPADAQPTSPLNVPPQAATLSLSLAMRELVLLDICGFESYDSSTSASNNNNRGGGGGSSSRAVGNDLEQLLINYTNESLQLLYLESTLGAMGDELRAEGVLPLPAAPLLPPIASSPASSPSAAAGVGGGAAASSSSIANAFAVTVADRACVNAFTQRTRPLGLLRVLADEGLLGQQQPSSTSSTLNAYVGGGGSAAAGQQFVTKLSLALSQQQTPSSGGGGRGVAGGATNANNNGSGGGGGGTSNRVIAPDPLNPNSFTVQHYCGPARYTADNFASKNRISRESYDRLAARVAAANGLAPLSDGVGGGGVGAGDGSFPSSVGVGGSNGPVPFIVTLSRSSLLMASMLSSGGAAGGPTGQGQGQLSSASAIAAAASSPLAAPPTNGGGAVAATSLLPKGTVVAQIGLRNNNSGVGAPAETSLTTTVTVGGAVKAPAATQQQQQRALSAAASPLSPTFFATSLNERGGAATQLSPFPSPAFSPTVGGGGASRAASPLFPSAASPVSVGAGASLQQRQALRSQVAQYQSDVEGIVAMLRGGGAIANANPNANSANPTTSTRLLWIRCIKPAPFGSSPTAFVQPFVSAQLRECGVYRSFSALKSEGAFAARMGIEGFCRDVIGPMLIALDGLWRGTSPPSAASPASPTTSLASPASGAPPPSLLSHTLSGDRREMYGGEGGRDAVAPLSSSKLSPQHHSASSVSASLSHYYASLPPSEAARRAVSEAVGRLYACDYGGLCRDLLFQPFLSSTASSSQNAVATPPAVPSQGKAPTALAPAAMPPPLFIDWLFADGLRTVVTAAARHSRATTLAPLASLPPALMELQPTYYSTSSSSSSPNDQSQPQRLSSLLTLGMTRLFMSPTTLEGLLLPAAAAASAAAGGAPIARVFRGYAVRRGLVGPYKEHTRERRIAAAAQRLSEEAPVRARLEADRDALFASDADRRGVFFRRAVLPAMGRSAKVQEKFRDTIVAMGAEIDRALRELAAMEAGRIAAEKAARESHLAETAAAAQRFAEKKRASEAAEAFKEKKKLREQREALARQKAAEKAPIAPAREREVIASIAKAHMQRITAEKEAVRLYAEHLASERRQSSAAAVSRHISASVRRLDNDAKLKAQQDSQRAVARDLLLDYTIAESYRRMEEARRAEGTTQQLQHGGSSLHKQQQRGSSAAASSARVRQPSPVFAIAPRPPSPPPMRFGPSSFSSGASEGGGQYADSEGVGGGRANVSLAEAQRHSTTNATYGNAAAAASLSNGLVATPAPSVSGGAAPIGLRLRRASSPSPSLLQSSYPSASAVPANSRGARAAFGQSGNASGMGNANGNGNGIDAEAVAASRRRAAAERQWAHTEGALIVEGARRRVAMAEAAAAEAEIDNHGYGHSLGFGYDTSRADVLMAPRTRGGHADASTAAAMAVAGRSAAFAGLTSSSSSSSHSKPRRLGNTDANVKMDSGGAVADAYCGALPLSEARRIVSVADAEAAWRDEQELWAMQME